MEVVTENLTKANQAAIMDIDEDAIFSTKDVLKIFTGGWSAAAKVKLFELEKQAKIPAARRKKRGKVEFRYWSLTDLPKIAKHFSKLSRPTKQLVISVYSPKGGVWKTTLTYNLARFLSLNGFKVLVVGLDSQCSVTSLLEQTNNIENLADYKEVENLSLYDFFVLEKINNIESLIKKTDIDNLHYIPENEDVDKLSTVFTVQSNGEKILKNKLIPLLKNYDVVLFDNPPSYLKLTLNALLASDAIISPLGCELEAFKAIGKTLKKVTDDLVENQEHKYIQIYVPTKHDNTTLSKQIQFEYQYQFKNEIIQNSLRSSVVGQEASYQKKSVIEYDTHGNLANDYYEVLNQIWQKIVG